MEYLYLQEKLSKQGYTFQVYGNQSLNSDLLNIRILNEGQTHFNSSTLYLTTTSQMPDTGVAGTFMLFCHGPAIDFSVYDHCDFHITYFGANISQADLFNFTMENLTELQQITAGMHLLVNALLTGNGLQYLVDTATDIFENPIYVIDLQNKYLAMSAGIEPENEFFNTESATGYISETGLQFIRENRINEKVRDNESAYYIFNTLVQKGMLIDRVQIQGIEVGHVMMMESEHAFRDFDTDFFHRFSKLISMELQKDSVYSRNKGLTYSYFLADLIKYPNRNINDIRERLEAMQYPFKETFYIIAIPPAGHRPSDLRLEVILNQIKYIISGSIYVIYENTIVFLISRDMNQSLSEYELTQLENYLNANHLKAGISNFFQSLENTARFYQQAVDSVHLGMKLKDPSSIYYYSDYYLYKMLELYEKEDSEIRYLIHPGLMKLYLYDQAHGTDFMDTLITHLKNPGQPAKIAEALHIHKNTLLYRMGKIKEITNCSFTEGNDFMNFNLSILIMRYLNML